MAKRGERTAERITVTCPCGKEFTVTKVRYEAGRGRRCSKECKNRYATRPSGLKYNVKRVNRAWRKPGDPPNATSFKKGQTPWNKGRTTGAVPLNAFQPGQVPWNKGTSGVMPGGEAHPMWRGDEVGYTGRHGRVYQARGPATTCINGCSHTHYEWAHRHGTDPLDVNNYDPMCKRCHVHYDSAMTLERAEEIRARYAAGGVSQRKLASEFGISQSSVSLILNRRIWIE